MTVATEVSRAIFNGSGGAGPFTFDFRFFVNSDITVTRTTNSITTTLTEIADYVLTGAGSYSGGAATLTNALAAGETLIVSRSMPLLQPTSIRNLGAFFPETHEDVFDRLTMMIQQVGDLAATNKIVAQGGVTGQRSDITADASAAPVNVDIAGLTAVTVTKDDATANAVTILDSSGATILRQATYLLYGLDEWVNLVKIGSNWKRIG